jgi:hypothetical protein
MSCRHCSDAQFDRKAVRLWSCDCDAGLDDDYGNSTKKSRSLKE